VKRAGVAVGTLALLAAACGSSAHGPGVAPGPVSATPTPSVQQVQGSGAVRRTTCTFLPQDEDSAGRAPGLPPTSVDATGTRTASVNTDRGDITFTMDAAKTPCTVASFTWLASKRFFDGTHCHRLTTAGIFVLQCGDPTGSGSGGPGYTIPDEALKGATYPAGTVAMANAGPNTGGSQFFLVYQDTQLGPSYTPFGHITTGLDVLRAVAAQGVVGGGTDGTPAESVTINSFRVTNDG
jgi:peptidyl-prolyl cis-trans isomerase B (cyclophilin B)